MKKLLLTFFCINLSVSICKGAQYNIDSLREELNTSKSKSELMDIFYYLGFELSKTIPDSGLYYAQKSLDLAVELNSQIRIADNYCQLGFSYYKVNQIDSSHYYWKKALPIYENLELDYLVAELKENIGFTMIFEGKYSEAEQYLNEAHQTYLALDTSNQYYVHINYGLLYDIKGEYDKALNHYLIAYRYVASKDDHYRMGLINSNLSAMYFYAENFERAIQYGLKSIKNWEEEKYELDRLSLFQNIAVSYEKIGKLDTALSFNYRALQIAKKYDSNWAVAGISNNIGVILLNENQVDSGLYYLQQAKEIKSSMSLREGTSSTYLELAKYYAKVGNSLLAIQHLKEAEQITKEINILEEIKTYYLYESEVYQYLNNPKKAIFSLKKYITYKDSLLNLETSEKIEELEIRYETEKRKISNELLQAENNSKSATILSQRYLLGFVSVGLIFLGSLANSYRLRRKSELEKRMLKERESELLEAENLRLLLSNEGLSSTIEKYEQDINAILNETWTINPNGRRPQKTKLGEIIAISTSVDKVNCLEYLLKDADHKPLERRSMKNLTNDPNLPVDLFTRIHQSHFVNLYNIASIDTTTKAVFLKHTSEVIYASDAYLENLLIKFKEIKTTDYSDSNITNTSGSQGT